MNFKTLDINMGCTLTSKVSERRISKQVSLKLSQGPIPLISTSSFLSRQGTLSRLNTVNQPVCLKIKILEEDSRLISANINLSGTQLYMASFEYITDFTYIKEFYSKFISAYRYFCNLVHEACIDNFEISDGIFIMHVSIASNHGISFDVVKTSPFFKIQGEIDKDTKDIVDAWVKLNEEISVILKNNAKKIEKCKKRLEVFMDLMKNNMEYLVRPEKIEKNIKVCKSATKIAEHIVNQAKSIREKSEIFYQNIKKHCEDIAKFGEKASCLDLHSGERIVHVLLKN